MALPTYPTCDQCQGEMKVVVGAVTTRIGMRQLTLTCPRCGAPTFVTHHPVVVPAQVRPSLESMARALCEEVA